jgi:hypothetical protein
VSKKRHRVPGFDALCGSRKTVGYITIEPPHGPGGHIKTGSHELADCLGGNGAIATVIPVDTQRLEGAFGLPPGIRDNRDRSGHLHDSAQPRRSSHRAFINSSYHPAKNRQCAMAAWSMSGSRTSIA